METLLNELGGAAVWPVVLSALPLIALGLVLRQKGRRGLKDALEAREAERPLRNLRAGRVAVRGRFRTAPDGRATVEDEGGRAYLERDPGASRIDDGVEVFVVGCATHRRADEQAGYRDGGSAWVIDARGDGNWISPRPRAFEHAVKRQRLRATLGAALFALGLAVAVGGSLVAWRAAHPTYDVVD